MHTGITAPQTSNETNCNHGEALGKSSSIGHSLPAKSSDDNNFELSRAMNAPNLLFGITTFPVAGFLAPKLIPVNHAIHRTQTSKIRYETLGHAGPSRGRRSN